MGPAHRLGFLSGGPMTRDGHPSAVHDKDADRGLREESRTTRRFRVLMTLRAAQTDSGRGGREGFNPCAFHKPAKYALICL